MWPPCLPTGLYRHPCGSSLRAEQGLQGGHLAHRASLNDFPVRYLTIRDLLRTQVECYYSHGRPAFGPVVGLLL